MTSRKRHGNILTIPASFWFQCDLCESWTPPASPEIHGLQHSNLHSGHFLTESVQVVCKVFPESVRFNWQIELKVSALAAQTAESVRITLRFFCRPGQEDKG